MVSSGGYFFPLSAMKNLFVHFRKDLLGGITAGIVALPLALAFGVSSGLGPSAGLYGAIFLSFFAALFGGTPTQISGPTAPMTAVSMVVISSIIAANEGIVQAAIPSILLVFLMAGLLQIGLGVLGLGRYIRYIPYPVVSGFMTAIGLIIIITQLLPALGYYPKEDQALVAEFIPEAEEFLLERILREEAAEDIHVREDFGETLRRSGEITRAEIEQQAQNLAGSEVSGVIGSIRTLPRAVRNIDGMELILCVVTIVIVFAFKRLPIKIPGTLGALLLVSGTAWLLGIQYRPIEEIPHGIPVPQIRIFTRMEFSLVTTYVFTALTLALLGAIDSLLTSVVADNITRTRYNPNKELIGQGIGNSISALFGGLPGAGATIRTVVNINAGGIPRLSGMGSGVLLLIILLALGPVASGIPAAVLAGILITVGINVMDYKGLRAIPSLPRDVAIGPISLSSEVIIMLVVLVLSAFWNLVYAVGIGLVIASLMFMKKIGDLTTKRSRIRSLTREEAWPDEKEFPEKLKDEIYIKHVMGPVFFGTTAEFHHLAGQIPKTAGTVIIRLGRMPYMDQTGLYAMEEVLQELIGQGIRVLLVNIQEQPRYLMERIGMIPDLVGEEYIFPDFRSCMDWVRKEMEVAAHGGEHIP